MREILFRAKVKCTSEMQVLLQYNEGEWVHGEIHLNARCPHMHANGRRYPIDPDTLGQYTGLNDKAGNKVFEGDILTSGNFIYVAEFHNGSFDLKSPTSGNFCANAMVCMSEVVGNIYDNKEMLKEAEEW